MNPIIELNNIKKAYGDLVALDDVSFSVDPGELFGLIGPDGSGKSTVYRILSTLLLPDSGEARVCGLNVATDYKRLRTIIGYMPEKFSLYSDLTVEENLNFFAKVFGVKVSDNFDLIAPIFGQLQKFPHRKAGKLSGGMKQKLALSCALIHRPKILLLDEPTTGVDAVSRSEFWNMLANLREQGISIMVSTSYMDEATRCDRIAMILRGKVLGVDTPENLVAGLDENLFNAVSGNMFRLLTELRELPSVKNCYTFGATLHVVASGDFNPSGTVEQLRAAGLTDVKIFPARGDIEDLFIKMSNNG